MSSESCVHFIFPPRPFDRAFWDVLERAAFSSGLRIPERVSAWKRAAPDPELVLKSYFSENMDSYEGVSFGLRAGLSGPGTGGDILGTDKDHNVDHFFIDFRKGFYVRRRHYWVGIDVEMALRLFAFCERIHVDLSCELTEARVDDSPNWFQLGPGETRIVIDEIPSRVLCHCNPEWSHVKPSAGEAEVREQGGWFKEDLVVNGHEEDLTLWDLVAADNPYFVQDTEYLVSWRDPTGEEAGALLRVCPACYGNLPKAPRDASYFNPDEDEQDRLRRLAWEALNLDELEKRLGPPDEVFSFPQGPKWVRHRHLGHEIDSITATRGAVYSRLSDQCVVVFKEFAEQMIMVDFAGKWRGPGRWTIPY